MKFTSLLILAATTLSSASALAEADDGPMGCHNGPQVIKNTCHDDGLFTCNKERSAIVR